MRALTLIQPYATLIVLGYKLLETRSWRTSHRGPLAIHAGSGRPPWARAVAERDELLAPLLRSLGLTFDALPRGGILGTCHVQQVHAITAGFAAGLSPLERAAGNYALTPPRYAWELADVQQFPELVACPGFQQLWRVPPAVEQLFPVPIPAALLPAGQGLPGQQLCLRL